MPTLSQRAREGWGNPNGYFIANQSRDEAALLDSHRSDAGERVAVFVFGRRQIADDEDFRIAGNAEIGSHENAAGAIERRP